MSIVIRRKNGDILWFDAITQYDVSYTSSVTKHPIGTGGYVSDHTTTDNVVLQISGVLSDADFNINRPENLGALRSYNEFDLGHVETDERGLYKGTSKQYTNNTNVANAVVISERASINKILPEVVAQFTKDTIPEVYLSEQDKAKTAKAVQFELIDMWRKREEFQVLDLVQEFVIDQFGPCIFTNLSFKEDVNSGDGLFPTMTIEEVVFTDLVETTVRIKTSNKGRKTGNVTKGVDGKVIPDPTDNKTNVADESKGSVLNYVTTPPPPANAANAGAF